MKCPSDNREIFSLEELVKEFDYRHMSKSPAVFDTTKLKWMNGEYLKAMDFDTFYEMAEPYIRKTVTEDYDLKKMRRSLRQGSRSFRILMNRSTLSGSCRTMTVSSTDIKR